MPRTAGPTDRVSFDLRLTLRILLVTDGAIGFWDTPLEPMNSGSNEGFSLRETARALWDLPHARYPYVRFVVDHAVHGTGAFATTSRSVDDDETGTTRAWTQYDPFRFDAGGFDLASYDQVWFFGYWPGNPRRDGSYAIPANRVELSDSELRIVADFMAAGGGVFATGDHGLLGSNLCGNVARVNKMRRWFDLGISNRTPSASDYDRIDTIVPVRTVNGSPEVRFQDQSDDTPKRLQLRRYRLWNGAFAPASTLGLFARWAPHPIMCTPFGPLATLPDHMHEGLVQRDEDVELEGFDPAGRPEFPGGANRPTPEVIASSRVFGGDVVYDDSVASPLAARTEPTVSAYDGQRAAIGRVVVDSTWHNWLDINVRGVGATIQDGYVPLPPGPPTGLLGMHLELVHEYVRNIAQWLATSAQRRWMREGLFLDVVTNTSGWSQVINIDELVGQQAENVLGRITSACTIAGLIFEPWWFEERLVALRASLGNDVALPPREVVERHVLAAMTYAAFELGRDVPRRSHANGASHDTDTPERFERIAARFSVARDAGVRELLRSWRGALERSERYFDAVEAVLERGTDDLREPVGRSRVDGVRREVVMP